jgi:phosphoribosylformylglycinamidine synthase II
MPVSKEVLDEIALSEKEYELIVQRLGREPSKVELGMFGALWSEHCGYKHSKPLLKLLPTKGKGVLTRVGEENAGAVNIGDGLSLVMKMESHNHPSAIEPFQGAATGVGGIVRDIFTMGARPIALLNSLRFGPLEEPHNRYLFNGVVGGIASYGNCLGIPDVGGEVFLSSSYSDNPLINAMCVGIAKREKLVKARAGGVGNVLMLVGADTGRDGLHGASGLASRTFEQERELRSTVQVGNPFLEKLLIEACLELAETDWIVGMQDLGAAGLTSAAVESAARSGSGLEIDISKVPRREQGMSPYEVMLSESQERMLVIVRKGYQDKVKALFERWELPSDLIGYVTGDGIARIKEGEKMVAEVPVKLLTDPPFYRLSCRKPIWLRQLQSFDLSTIPDLPPDGCQLTLLKLLACPNIASKHWVYRQYDHQVETNTVVPPGGDAAVLRIKDTKKAISLTTDGNGRYCYLDPYNGGAIAVAEAARNLVCTGAGPLAITDCLNLGNPEKNDIYYQLKECIRGMARACRQLNIPVISGNVSLYNETKGKAIYPTPVIGMVGLIEDVNRHCTGSFKDEGDVVFLLGSQDEGGLAGSEYLEVIHGLIAGGPFINLDLEKRVQRCCLSLIKEGIIKSAHDCSDGGLAVALAECCLAGDVGFRGGWRIQGRIDAALFGELQSRVIVSVAPTRARELGERAAQEGIGLGKLGVVGGKRLIIEGVVDVPLEQMAMMWHNGLDWALKGLSKGGVDEPGRGSNLS